MTTVKRRRRALRRRRARSRVLAPIAVAIAIAAVLLALQPGSRSPRGASAAARAGLPRAPGAEPGRVRRRPDHRRARAVQSAAQRRDDRAIDAVLRYTPFVTSGGTRRREIALTFDDGPSSYTKAILAILRRTHVKATFFVVGQQLNDFAGQFRAELRDGMQVEDHTENHAWLSHLKRPAQLNQIRDAGLRERLLGAPSPRLFRPPYGAFNKTTIALTRAGRMLIVLWSVDPADWARPGTAAIIQRVLRNARPGAIVLMHDGGGYRNQTVAALPAVIAGLHKRGFELVTVAQLLRDDPPSRHQKLPAFTGA